MRKSRRLLALAAVVGSAALVALLLGGPLGGLGLRQFENYTLDLRQQTTVESFQAGRGERESDIVLVLFDEYTVTDTLDGWPWITPFPRVHIAQVIDALSAAGARTIGVDVFLGELFPGLNRIDGGNDLLRTAMERAGNVILVNPVEQTDSGPTVRQPHPFFLEVAAGVGTAELPSSFDTFREGTLAVRSGNDLEPSFALALYAHGLGLDVDSILEAGKRTGRISLPGLPRDFGRIPRGWLDGTDESQASVIAFPIRFHGPPSSTDDLGPPGTFQAIASSAVETLTLFAPELFEDKIVLMGTGFHAQDRFRTPFFSYTADAADDEPAATEYGWMYGVEVHANALENMLDGTYVRRLSRPAEILLLLIVAAIAGGLVFARGAGWGALALVVTLAGSWVVAYWGWAGSAYLPGSLQRAGGSVGLWVPIGTTSVSAFLAYVGSVAYTAIIEGREKRFIKGAFGKYVSPDLVAEITEDPSALELGGEKVPLSLLFSDLSGFTTLSEEMDAQELIAMLNEYLQDMTDVVFEEYGTLDKYIGDAIMAFWNAPTRVPDHPDRAMRTAILMQRRMDDLNRRWHDRGTGRETLKVRIGVHTGDVVVGNVGGKDRFDYSAIGDAVNLAARLEPANKTYDTLNMVSEVTLAMAEGRYRVRELDTIAVKGKEAPVTVFELLEMDGVALSPSKEAALKHYAAGLNAYKQHEWTKARGHFSAAVEACPDDGPSLLYVERCIENEAEPPPPDWDFVVRRTEK